MKRALCVLTAWLVSSILIFAQSTTTTSSYSGTGSVTRKKATTIVSNLFEKGIRIAALGSITSSDNKVWTVPASVAFSDSAFPFAPDLYNEYVNGHTYKTSDEAERALSESDIVVVNTDGAVFTAYVFADNYFEMYINGIPVGKDAVPFTAFNSSIIRFKVKKPFTIAVQCVDWEENLGLGTERMGDELQHIGDGGFVAAIKNTSGEIEAVTDASWKAQTFYTAPIANLSCLKEENGVRYSDQCTGTTGTSESYGVHWEIPSYTNFTNVFDNKQHDASFIWSTNLRLDNVVLLRKKVE